MSDRRRNVGIAVTCLALLAAVIAALVYLATSALAVLAPPGDAPAPARPVAAVSDDDPRFDCRTMGNRRCGPGATLPDGTRVDVPAGYVAHYFPDGSRELIPPLPALLGWCEAGPAATGFPTVADCKAEVLAAWDAP